MRAPLEPDSSYFGLILPVLVVTSVGMGLVYTTPGDTVEATMHGYHVAFAVSAVLLVASAVLVRTFVRALPKTPRATA